MSGQLPDGKQGNVDTITFMKKIARQRAGFPIVRKMALNILTFYGVPSSYYLAESEAIGDYIKKNVRYVRDPDGIEYLQAPEDLIEQMKTGQAQGDCDDMALLIASLLLSIGHQPLYRAARYREMDGHYNHIYVVDYEHNKGAPRQRIVLDAIVKDQDIGFEVSQMSGDEYPI